MSLKLQCSNCFKALSVPSRMKLYLHLEKAGEATVTQLVEGSGLKQPTVSYHLKEMEQGGVLSSRKVGKEVFYKIANACPHDSKQCVITGIYANN